MTTKDKILDGAQALFLKNGYAKTTVRMIANEVNVNLGLLPYYFEKKENMGIEIYSRYMSVFYEKIDYKDYSVNSSIEHMLLTYLMLQYYMNMEKGLLKLYIELLKEDVLKYAIEGYSFRSLELIQKEYGIELDNSSFAATLNIIRGVERALIIGASEEKLDMNFFDINTNIVKCALLYIGIERSIIDENIDIIRKKMTERNIDFKIFEYINEY